MTESELRQIIRLAYDFACGYCGVREEETGNELELDHFCPCSADGGNEPENLVYCCTACNRFKGDFWMNDRNSTKRILHPKLDDLSQHLRLETVGKLVALTETGDFHLSKLRLNRPPLVALRQARLENERLRKELKEAKTAQEFLSERLAATDKEIEQILEEIARLSGE